MLIVIVGKHKLKKLGVVWFMHMFYLPPHVFLDFVDLCLDLLLLCLMLWIGLWVLLVTLLGLTFKLSIDYLEQRNVLGNVHFRVNGVFRED